MISDDEFNRYINNAFSLSDRNRNVVLNGAHASELIAYRKKLDIDSFLSLIYSIMDKLNMIKTSNNSEISDKSKFLLTHSYPDNTNGTIIDNVITYEVISRCPAKFDTKAISVSQTSQIKPRYLCDVKDMFENELCSIYISSYDNEVKFICWSEKAEDAHRLAMIIENFFIKYYPILKYYSGPYKYIGRQPMIVSSDYGPKKIFGIPMIYMFRTDEPNYVRQSEIISIDIIDEMSQK